jgi:hypothetical protein
VVLFAQKMMSLIFFDFPKNRKDPVFHFLLSTAANHCLHPNQIRSSFVEHECRRRNHSTFVWTCS